MKKTNFIKTAIAATACLILYGFNVLNPFNCFAQANGTGAGNCLSYDGMNDYVGMSSQLPLTDKNVFSASAWVKLDASTTSGTVIQIQGNQMGGNSGNAGLSIVGDKAGMFWYAGGNSGNISCPNCWYVSDVSTLPLNTWIFITGVWERSGSNITGTLYVNGVNKGTNTSGLMTATGAFNSYTIIGSHSWNMDYIDASIDEVCIWNKALTETEIRNNMCKKLTGNETGLVGYWRFDEGSGGTANDASGNGNNGTLY